MSDLPAEKRDALAAVLAEHDWITLDDGLPGCRCGWINARVSGPRPTHLAHLAAALAPLIAGWLAEAEQHDTGAALAAAVRALAAAVA